MTAPAPPTYLKIWIRHWESFKLSLSSQLKNRIPSVKVSFDYPSTQAKRRLSFTLFKFSLSSAYDASKLVFSNAKFAWWTWNIILGDPGAVSRDEMVEYLSIFEFYVTLCIVATAHAINELLT